MFADTDLTRRAPGQKSVISVTRSEEPCLQDGDERRSSRAPPRSRTSSAKPVGDRARGHSGEPASGRPRAAAARIRVRRSERVRGRELLATRGRPGSLPRPTRPRERDATSRRSSAHRRRRQRRGVGRTLEMARAGRCDDRRVAKAAGHHRASRQGELGAERRAVRGRQHDAAAFPPHGGSTRGEAETAAGPRTGEHGVVDSAIAAARSSPHRTGSTSIPRSERHGDAGREGQHVDDDDQQVRRRARSLRPPSSPCSNRTRNPPCVTARLCSRFLPPRRRRGGKKREQRGSRSGGGPRCAERACAHAPRPPPTSPRRSPRGCG